MNDYRETNRDRKVKARREAMKVNGRSVFTIQRAIEKRATEPVKRGGKR